MCLVNYINSQLKFWSEKFDKVLNRVKKIESQITMHKCNFCQELFHNTQLLLIHVKNVHDNENVFNCAFDNRNRSYNIFNPFKKHVLKHDKKNCKNNVEIDEPSNVDQPIFEQIIDEIINEDNVDELIFLILMMKSKIIPKPYLVWIMKTFLMAIWKIMIMINF